MSQRKGASNSKFGHLFGDTSDSSSTSSSQSRLSGDLYRDPLAALMPPITATTTTTRGGATAVKATLSPPPSTTSASAAASAASSSARSSPPGSGTNSRSSSRLQHNVLFSSLTSNDSGGSLFDSIGPASSTLSAAKRDLLFGEASSSGVSSSSSLRRISTPPLSKNNINSASGTAPSSQQSSRISTPLLGGARLTIATLDAEASPLGLPLGNSSSKLQGNEDDVLSIKSPLSATEPLTRTNSQASIKSHDSVKSSKSFQDTVEDTKKPAAVKPISTGTMSASTGPTSPSSIRSIATKGAAAKTDLVFNPLISDQSQPTSSTISGQASAFSVTSQSIETFQAISRSSSPTTNSTSVIFPSIPISKSGFERENDTRSPPPISKSRVPINVSIMDDAAEAFEKDLLFSSGPVQPTVTTTSTLRSSSFLDSGFTSSRMSSNTFDTEGGSPETTVIATMGVGASGVGASTVGQSKSRSGFSLGEDVADSSNPWTNTLVDSLNQTKLDAGEDAKVVYAQTDANFISDVVFTIPPSTKINSTTAITEANPTHSSRSTLKPILPLEDDIGGFNDVLSSLRSSRGTNTTDLAIESPLQPSQPLTGASSWNVLDAVAAAAKDPDFMGPNALVSQGTDKVLAMMQMPKIALDKDVSAQEVFDNPWE
ncbi:hypothetical protein BGZ49_008836 [Haplosporangium sp. Z 27]|nr:hypothetical protein BGZ49_008836 [Haplosporangium sp. Z 27]